jgi:hypothetical protein
MDLSEQGAAVRDVPAVPIGTTGSLELDGVEERLPFSVQGTQDGVLHVGFVFDSAAAERFRCIPERLAQRRAA